MLKFYTEQSLDFMLSYKHAIYFFYFNKYL